MRRCRSAVCVLSLSMAGYVSAQEATSLLGRPSAARPATPELVQAVAALERSPSSVPQLIATAQAYDQLWQFERSIALYTRALALEPSNSRALSYRGQRYISVRRFDDAIVDLDRAHTLDPDSFDALYHLGPRVLLHGAIWHRGGHPRTMSGGRRGLTRDASGAGAARPLTRRIALMHARERRTTVRARIVAVCGAAA